MKIVALLCCIISATSAATYSSFSLDSSTNSNALNTTGYYVYYKDIECWSTTNISSVSWSVYNGGSTSDSWYYTVGTAPYSFSSFSYISECSCTYKTNCFKTCTGLSSTSTYYICINNWNNPTRSTKYLYGDFKVTPNCPAGSFGLLGSPCSKCQEGSYSESGSSSCTPCYAGFFSLAGSPTCTKCLANTYVAADKSSCTACPANTESLAGSDILADCVTTISTCSAGSYLKLGICTPCGAGKIV